MRSPAIHPLLLLALLAAAVLSASCSDEGRPASPGDPDAGGRFTLLALGDSYTVGEGIQALGRWPDQLADSLLAGGDTLEVDILAATGWTSTDLLAALRDTAPEPRFDLVTVMIGVNNQFCRLPEDRYPADLDTLLAEAVRLAGGAPDRVLTLSIPDYSVTPVGGMFGREELAAAIDRLNAAGARTAAEAGVGWIDVTALSRTAAERPELVARDGLHFSAAMHSLWVEAVLPEVRAVLQNSGFYCVPVR